MTMNVRGYAAQSAANALVPFRFERREPRPDDVVIEILYCGICHSDLHTVRNDWASWFPTTYPVVPGHEIIGRVTNVGKDVKRFKPGDHVGVGCMVDSCQKCSACAGAARVPGRSGADIEYCSFGNGTEIGSRVRHRRNR